MHVAHGVYNAAMDKRSVARNSVLASTLLTFAKLAVGFYSGSLAMISEALHSALDLLATVATWQSVRISDLPADKSHHYGHEKIEHLAAFTEGILLFLTALWIAKRATTEFFTPTPLPRTNIWPFLVIAISLVVDASRSRALRRAGRQFSSAALSADARHYTVDLGASAVVLLSLLAIHFYGNQARWADPVGALLIAVIMLATAIHLARNSADALMDRAPDGLAPGVQETMRRVAGVCDVPRIRVRQSGTKSFVDATITVDPQTSIQEGHRIASSAELAATERFPALDITLHVEPASAGASHVEAIYDLAAGMGLPLHAVRVREINARLYINFHVELPPEMPLGEAHKTVTELEERIRMRLPAAAEVDGHLEPGRDGAPANAPGGATRRP